MDPRLNSPARADPAAVADGLDRERRFEALGHSLSTLRVFLVLVVQMYLLCGFALIFVRPPSPSFYMAILVLLINTLLAAGCAARGLWLRRRMRRLLDPQEQVSE